MKSFLVATLILLVSPAVFSTVSGKKIVQGVVQAFDQDTVTLENDGKKVKVKRNKFVKGTKFNLGAIVEIELSDEDYNSLKAF